MYIGQFICRKSIHRLFYTLNSGADAGGGGVQGSKEPPGPQRGDPGPLFQNEENSIYYLQFYLIPPNKSL